MNRLTEIGIKHNTDKADYHRFTEFYHDYMVKYTNPRLLEIGIYDGASLKMWEEFFGSPIIVGVDIEPKKQYETLNIKTLVADQSKPEELLKCLEICNEYDIIVDDGGHTMQQQLVTIATLFPYLKSGGLYVLEDLHTSFIGDNYNPYRDSLTAYEFLHRVKNKLELETPYVSPTQLEYIRNNVELIELFQRIPTSYFHSITSVIIKK
jgi:cephalosporin hydroxylase